VMWSDGCCVIWIETVDMEVGSGTTYTFASRFMATEGISHLEQSLSTYRFRAEMVRRL
jgi:hypothetical protein